ncbi:MAG: class I SAM-dependent methyltransferase [Acidobacteriota bacterium]
MGTRDRELAGAESGFLETADIETSSDEYARRFDGRVGRWFLDVQERATLAMLRPYPGATVLDVGGGHGQLTPALVRAGHKVMVLGSAEVCRKRVQAYVDQGLCAFDAGDLLALPYADASFDVTVSYRLMAHVIRWKRFVSELARVSRLAVILDYPSVRSLNYAAPLLFGVKRRYEETVRPFTCFREADLLDELRLQGFEPGARFPQYFFPMLLHRMLRVQPLSAAAERICRAVGLTERFGSPVILRVRRTMASQGE